MAFTNKKMHCLKQQFKPFLECKMPSARRKMSTIKMPLYLSLIYFPVQMSRTFKNVRKKLCRLRREFLPTMHFIDTMHLSDYNYISTTEHSNWVPFFRSPQPSVPLKAFPNINYHVVVVSVLESLSRAQLLLLSSSLEREEKLADDAATEHKVVIIMLCVPIPYPRS